MCVCVCVFEMFLHVVKILGKNWKPLLWNFVCLHLKCSHIVFLYNQTNLYVCRRRN